MDCADKKALRVGGGEEGLAEARLAHRGEEGAGIVQIPEGAHLHTIEGCGRGLRLAKDDAEVVAQPTAAAEGKGQVTSATTPTAATVGATLSSRGAESLHKAMTNYLKSGDTAAATALFHRYEGRITPSQRTRFVKLLQGYNITL